MKKQQENMEQILRDELHSEADAIREEIRASDIEDISEDQKEAIQKQLQKRIAQYEAECSDELTDMDIYAKLSKKDREALEIGRKVQERQKRVHKKRSRKMYLALAAALVLVLAIGMTSMGGAERITKVIKKAIGGREVTKVTSDENNKVIENEDEEKAYQEIKDTFGVEPVKLVSVLKEMKFIQMDLDENLQIGKLLYNYNGENMIYIISADYRGASFGIDVEDEIVDQEEISINGNNVELTIYEVKTTKKVKCSANFKYKGLEYFLVGKVSKKEFMIILNNLFFF
ncbi:MAG: DUF4367 domain-containing protein [Lachnospiraceae bacterium]